MPQMAPIKWLLMFFIFLIIFIMFNMMNYYSYLPNSPTFLFKNKKNFSMNWKW